jgi:hypothetical protein
MNVCSAACGFCGACESGTARVELTCKRCGHGFDIFVEDWPRRSAPLAALWDVLSAGAGHTRTQSRQCGLHGA